MKEKEIGITKDFDRKNYDDFSRRNGSKDSFKNREFGEKQTLKDYYTGETLHKSSNAAKNKYGETAHTKHTSDVDHIVPLKKIHEQNKSNPFLKDSDLKEVANSDSNLRITSAKINRQKSDKTNIEYTLNSNDDIKTKAKMIKDGVVAQGIVTSKLSSRTVKNMGQQLYDGGKEAATITLAIEGTKNLFDVISGKKDIKEALEHTTVQVGKSFTVAGGSRLTSIFVNHYKDNLLKKVGNSSLQKMTGTLTKSNVMLQTVNTGLLLKDSIINYANGDITDEEFVIQIGEVALNCFVVASMGPVGIPCMVATIATSHLYRECIAFYKELTAKNPDEIRLAKISTIASQALYEMEKQRESLKQSIKNTYTNWDNEIKTSYEELYLGVYNDDVNGLSLGLNRILNLFEENLTFKTYSEFKEFFDDEDSVLKF